MQSGKTDECKQPCNHGHIRDIKHFLTPQKSPAVFSLLFPSPIFWKPLLCSDSTESASSKFSYKINYTACSFYVFLLLSNVMHLRLLRTVVWFSSLCLFSQVVSHCTATVQRIYRLGWLPLTPTHKVAEHSSTNLSVIIFLSKYLGVGFAGS